MDGAFSNFFSGSDHTVAYKKFRPTYPEELVKEIVKFGGEKLGDLKFVVDVGCGSGQSTAMLSDHSERVLGVDISPDQIKQAKASTMPSNVEFSVGSCEAIPVDALSVDLITVGTAVHWFDLDKFYKEVDRVLKPGGALAIYTYNGTQAEIEDDAEKTDEINAMLRKFEYEVMSVTRPKQWQDLFNDPQNTFSLLELPYRDSRRDVKLALKNRRTVAGMVGLIKSYSECKEFLRTHPNGDEAFTDLQNKIMAVLKTDKSADETQITCVLPIFLAMSRKPIFPSAE
ncbi:putative methyltransferase DDB_G0268948 isoform X2 [Ptychodera flava]|uniref:putative methyltransferase DDB_G0268948 isoform X2 n=1 Tax=Ptychodera flava TaxID=63121 RepID=UPI003969F286